MKAAAVYILRTIASGYFDYWQRNAGTSPDNNNDNNNTAEDNVSRLMATNNGQANNDRGGHGYNK